MSDDVVKIGHKAGMSRSALIEVLLLNQKKAVSDGREWEDKAFCWVPSSGSCPLCQSSLERTAPRLGGHWASGTIRCTSNTCTYREGSMSHIAKSIFPVQPMSEGAGVCFYNDATPPSDIANESAAVGAQSICDAEDTTSVSVSIRGTTH